MSTALLAVTATASTALAADLPSRVVAPVFAAPPSISNWTGFYVGGNAGYTETSSNNVSVTNAGGAALGAGIFFPPGIGINLLGGPSTTSQKRDGFIGGGQVGYNRQFGAAVAGVEADIQGLSNSGSSGTFGSTAIFPAAVPAALSTAFASQDTITRRVDYIGTVRGRLGYTFGSLLVYGTGGLAYGETRLGNSVAFPALGGAGIGLLSTLGGSSSETRTSVGWTAGGGVEYGLTEHWSVKAEALYYDLGRQSVTTPVGFTFAVPVPAAFTRPATVTTSVRNDGYIARAGLNYRFGFDPASVVARY